MRGFWLHIAFGLISLSLFSQDYGFINKPLSQNELDLWQSGTNTHLNLKPYLPLSDSTYFLIEKSNYQNFKTKEDPNSKWQNWSLQPVLEVGGGIDLSNTDQIIHNEIGGFQASYTNKKNWYGQIKLAGYQVQNPSYLQQISDSLHIVPGLGYSSSGNNGSNGIYATGKVGLKANKFFSLEMGNDKHFWGDGYRSLILSQNAAPYPYFKVTTDVWKVRYVNIWAQMRDISRGERWADARKKWTSIHALSWNFHSKWNLTLYEMVVWQAEDTLSDRGMDLNYLNPVIFYRPIEFGLGSADNEIVGLSCSFRPNTKNQFYTQLLLDEFLFSELVDRSGWWANKFGVQFGFKSFDFIAEGLNIQSEFNYVRPFTYTHGSVLQNWGHINQSLAHPLGTNFIEWVNHLVYRKNNWEISNEFLWAIYGRDRDGDNYGGDLFRSYKNPSKDYGNYIAQGLKSTLLFNEFKISKEIPSRIPIDLSLSYLFRSEVNEFFEQENHMIFLSLSCNPIFRYRDF